MPQSDPMEAFYDGLQNLVVDQAKRIINLSLYTKAVLSTIPVAMLATDENGLLRTANRAAEEVLGFVEKEARKKPIAHLFQGNAAIEEKTRQVLEQGEPAHMGGASIRLSSGKKIVGNLYFHPILDEEQAVCGILLSVEDMTYIHFLNDAFKRYVPPSVSEMIARNPRQLQLGGEDRVLSVLFCDIIGFTTYSERYSPNEMVTLLSEYFAEMTEQVFEYEGTLKEYVGDELMAIFGAPVHQPDHALRACNAALAMKSCLAALRERWRKMNRPPIRARIGVNSGNVLVGNLGSRYRFSYGAIGDQVNLASRLEGLCGKYGVDILIGENTYEQLEGRFYTREVDQVRVKGRHQPVRIFELIQNGDSRFSCTQKSCLCLYEEALDAYRNRLWTKAALLFEKAARAHENDPCSLIMAARCREYEKKPPETDWDGVYQLTTK